MQRDKQNYDRLSATDGDNSLESSIQIDMMRAWLQLSGTKAEDTAVRHDCNTKTSLDMSFSYTDEKKKPVLVTQYKKELARHKYILEMRTLGDRPYRRCHSLDLSVRPGGLVVHWDQKEEVMGCTGDIGIIAVAL